MHRSCIPSNLQQLLLLLPNLPPVAPPLQIHHLHLAIVKSSLSIRFNVFLGGRNVAPPHRGGGRGGGAVVVAVAVAVAVVVGEADGRRKLSRYCPVEKVWSE